MAEKYALVVASVASMIEQFNMHNIRLLQEQGYIVHVAANFEKGNTISNERIEQLKEDLTARNVIFFQVDFSRNVLNFLEHKKALSQLQNIRMNTNYAIMHCHSPIGGILSRLVFRGETTKIIYTAHGFQFYKGGSLLDWILFFPIEYLFSHFTDVLVTINQEDFGLANHCMRANKVYKINGVGIEFAEIRNYSQEREIFNLRKSLALSSKEIVLVSVGELSDRKNHIVIIKALEKLRLSNLTYVIIGQGEQMQFIQNYVKKAHLDKKVHLLGYRKDISCILKECDIFCFPSKREGLGLAAIEAMAAGLPIITSDSNGINDYSVYGETGYKFHYNDVEGFARGIQLLLDKNQRERMGKHNIEIAKKFDIDIVNKQMENIYSQL